MLSFFKNKGPFEINWLLKKINFKCNLSLKKTKVKNISTLQDAKTCDISFFDNPQYLNDLLSTNASFCFIKNNQAHYLNKSKTIPLISSNPLLDFILLAKEFYPEAVNDNYKFIQNAKYKSFTKQGTYIDKTVKIGKKFSIGLNSSLKKNVLIGNNVRIGSNCVISNTIIQDNVIINDGSVIGKIGYGFKFFNNNFNFIPHIGHVLLKENSYVGSNCSIDRGSFSNTIIGNGTMIDNNVHVAHNVKIGSYCIITGQVGIAGSATIGNKCMIGGQSGISGHIKIGDNVHIGGHSGVLNNIESGSKVMGYPAVPIREFLKKNIKKGKNND